ncbi:tRNA-specific adenosine deaminase [candidate division KSB1 bacterium]|nr:MAG: tRNA-specific adenosine deaminase [candidate division KSB1 bacterium]
MIKTHIHWMKIALKEAEKAYTKNEIPVGAVIIHNGKIIGKGYNQVEKLKDPTAHAEIIAITSAVNTIGSKFLENCSMYVTLEPCVMCSGAIILSRLENLIFGAKDPKSGAFGSVYNINEDNKLNHKVNVISGILEEECALIIKKFFLKLRNDS